MINKCYVSYYKNGNFVEFLLNLNKKNDLSIYFKLKKSYEKGYIQDLNIIRVKKDV